MQETMHSEDNEKLISVARQEILDKFGIVFPLVEDGKARGELVLRPEHRNHYGIPFRKQKNSSVKQMLERRESIFSLLTRKFQIISAQSCRNTLLSLQT